MKVPCFECDDGVLESRLIEVTHELRGVEVTFPARMAVCDHCGARQVPLSEANAFGAALDKAFREKCGLLSKDEIRQARMRLKMSQTEFADYIGVGEASIKRWELGAIQDKSSDEIIRLKTDPLYARLNLDQLHRRLRQRSPIQPDPGLLKGTRRQSRGRAGFRDNPSSPVT